MSACSGILAHCAKYCACKKPNSVDHILTCNLGGYVSMRHNFLRDTEARLMENVCKDVQTEPTLLPDQNSNRPDGERPDISARGMWSPAEKTFFDIQVTHPNAESYLDKPLSAIYREKEAQKKRKYNDRMKGQASLPWYFQLRVAWRRNVDDLINNLLRKLHISGEKSMAT